MRNVWENCVRIYVLVKCFRTKIALDPKILTFPNLFSIAEHNHFNLFQVYHRIKPYYLFPLLIFTLLTVNKRK